MSSYLWCMNWIRNEMYSYRNGNSARFGSTWIRQNTLLMICVACWIHILFAIGNRIFEVLRYKLMSAIVYKLSETERLEKLFSAISWRNLIRLCPMGDVRVLSFLSVLSSRPGPTDFTIGPPWYSSERGTISIRIDDFGHHKKTPRNGCIPVSQIYLNTVV